MPSENAVGELELTVLMPCLNEAETIGSCIKKATAWIRASGVVGEVLVADNGSNDGSKQIAASLGARVVCVGHKGYGAAIYGGCMAARGTYIIMGDADDSYDFGNLQPLMDSLRQGNDLVVGNRFSGGIRSGAMPWKNRYIGNPALTGIGRLLFRSPIRDFHCGLRGFRKDSFLRMDLHTTGMEFASEMIIKATLLGMRIAEVPTTLDKDGRSRPPHLRPWRDGWRHLRFLLIFSPRWLFFYPGAIVMFAGLVIFLRLFMGPVTIGDVGFSNHTMVFCSIAIILGYQSVLFSILTKTYALTHGLHPFLPVYQRLFDYIKLETGLAVGGSLILVGLCGALVALCDWYAHDFGPLEAGSLINWAVLSMVSLSLGVQTVFFSFFLSIIGMKMDRNVQGE